MSCFVLFSTLLYHTQHYIRLYLNRKYMVSFLKNKFFLKIKIIVPMALFHSALHRHENKQPVRDSSFPAVTVIPIAERSPFIINYLFL